MITSSSARELLEALPEISPQVREEKAKDWKTNKK